MTAPGLILAVQNSLQAGERFPLKKSMMILGRDPSNDISLEEHSISRQHARITRNTEGEFWVEDLDSTNGTYVNGAEVNEPCQIHYGDRLRIGLHIELMVTADAFTNERVSAAGQNRPTVRVQRSGPPIYSLRVMSGQQANQVVPLSLGEHPIGRDASNKIVISDPEVSGKHAMLQVMPEGIWVKDLDSANGTYVNNQAITDPVWLRPGDTLQLGPTVLASLQYGVTGGTGSLQLPQNNQNTTQPHTSPLNPMNPSSVEIPTWLLIALLSLMGVIFLSSMIFIAYMIVNGN